MSIRRAIAVVVTDDPAGTRAFYENFLGFRAGMEQQGAERDGRQLRDAHHRPAVAADSARSTSTARSPSPAATKM